MLRTWVMQHRTSIVALSAALVSACITATLFLTFHGPRPSRRSFGDARGHIAMLQLEEMESALELSSAQVASFQALYEEYTAATVSQRPRLRPTDGGSLSDEELNSIILSSFSSSRSAIDLKERYYHRFRKILTPTQISKMYDIERRTRDRFTSELERRKRDVSQPSGASRPSPTARP